MYQISFAIKEPKEALVICCSRSCSSLSYCTVTQTSWKQEMKRSRAEGAMLPAKATAEASGKAQRRQKASTPKLATAVASPENAAARGGGDDKNPAAAAAAAAADIRQSSFIPSAPAEEEAVGWGDGAVELGEWWWCLWGVEEEKLLGWFPFVDEDFVCSDSRGSEAPGGLLWEEEDHDIWELQHIHEIPHAAAK